MSHFDDLTPDESDALMDALFPPDSNARKIIDSTPPHERALLDQALADHRERRQADRERRLLMATFDPERAAAEAEEERREQEKFDAFMDAMTPADWARLEATLHETEREILRERGIDPAP